MTSTDQGNAWWDIHKARKLLEKLGDPNATDSEAKKVFQKAKAALECARTAYAKAVKDLDDATKDLKTATDGRKKAEDDLKNAEQLVIAALVAKVSCASPTAAACPKG